MSDTDSLLTDQDKADPTIQYVQPKYIETTLSKEKKQECRDIVKVINDFGVSQRQKLFLVWLLALELENMQLVKDITKLFTEFQAKVTDSKIVVEEAPKKKLIL